jgi:hypothetical protein
VAVHQPPDHEDDKDQPQYAVDPNGSALTIIAAAVEPKPASKENHEQHDDQNQFHRFVFHQFIGNQLPNGAGRQLYTRPVEPVVEWRPSHPIKGAKYTSDRKQRFAMRDGTMSSTLINFSPFSAPGQELVQLKLH